MLFSSLFVRTTLSSSASAAAIAANGTFGSAFIVSSRRQMGTSNASPIPALFGLRAGSSSLSPCAVHVHVTDASSSSSSSSSAATTVVGGAKHSAIRTPASPAVDVVIEDDLFDTFVPLSAAAAASVSHLRRRMADVIPSAASTINTNNGSSIATKAIVANGFVFPSSGAHRRAITGGSGVDTRSSIFRSVSVSASSSSSCCIRNPLKLDPTSEHFSVDEAITNALKSTAASSTSSSSSQDRQKVSASATSSSSLVIGNRTLMTPTTTTTAGFSHRSFAKQMAIREAAITRKAAELEAFYQRQRDERIAAEAAADKERWAALSSSMGSSTKRIRGSSNFAQ